MRWRLWAEELRQDLTFGIRMLARQRGLTTVAVLTIALGVAATAIVFAVVHAALLAPLPYRDANRLVVTRLSVPDYKDLRESARAFASTGIWASNLYTLDDEQVLGGVVSPSVFTTLGVVARGRPHDRRRRRRFRGGGAQPRHCGSDDSVVIPAWSAARSG